MFVKYYANSIQRGFLFVGHLNKPTFTEQTIQRQKSFIDSNDILISISSIWLKIYKICSYECIAFTYLPQCSKNFLDSSYTQTNTLEIEQNLFSPEVDEMLDSNKALFKVVHSFTTLYANSTKLHWNIHNELRIYNRFLS